MKKIYSEVYEQDVYIHLEKGYPHCTCSRCGKELKEWYVIQDEDAMELSYLGKECIKHLR